MENKKNPKVTIAIRSYNHEKYISQAIESVISQTYQNLEIIIVNDASTDTTDEIIKKYKERDPRIMYINNQINQGRIASDNIIFKNATGEYMARLDGDDYWTDITKIEQQADFLTKNPEYTLTGNFVENVNEDGTHRDYQSYQIEDSHIRKHILTTNQLAASGVMFRTEVLRMIGGFSPRYSYIDDLEIWLQMGAIGKFHNFPHYWTAHRMTGTNAGELKRRDQIKEVITLIKHHKSDYPHYTRARVKLFIEHTAFSLPQPIINFFRSVKRMLKT